MEVAAGEVVNAVDQVGALAEGAGLGAVARPGFAS